MYSYILYNKYTLRFSAISPNCALMRYFSGSSGIPATLESSCATSSLASAVAAWRAPGSSALNGTDGENFSSIQADRCRRTCETKI